MIAAHEELPFRRGRGWGDSCHAASSNEQVACIQATSALQHLLEEGTSISTVLQRRRRKPPQIVVSDRETC